MLTVKTVSKLRDTRECLKQFETDQYQLFGYVVSQCLHNFDSKEGDLVAQYLCIMYSYLREINNFKILKRAFIEEYEKVNLKNIDLLEGKFNEEQDFLAIGLDTVIKGNKIERPNTFKILVYLVYGMLSESLNEDF